MKYLQFRGKAKNTDDQSVVMGYGCYTDCSSREFVITDEPVYRTYVQVEKIELVEDDK